jgi:hypothetical protein
MYIVFFHPRSLCSLNLNIPFILTPPLISDLLNRWLFPIPTLPLHIESSPSGKPLEPTRAPRSGGTGRVTKEAGAETGGEDLTDDEHRDSEDVGVVSLECTEVGVYHAHTGTGTDTVTHSHSLASASIGAYVEGEFGAPAIGATAQLARLTQDEGGEEPDAQETRETCGLGALILKSQHQSGFM